MNKMDSSSGVNSVRTKTNQNIQVYVRVRPLNSRERMIRSQEVVEVQSSKEIVVRQLFDSKTTKKFTFDRSFGPDSKQSEVYHSVVAPLIEEVLAGYNCTVFAYGQTGTGKTHTMIGTECPELKSSWEDDSMVGIIPRALSHLFDELRMMEVEFSMRISYLELYNEELCDLLSTDDATKIRIFDDSTKKGSVIVQGLEEIPVHSKDDVYKLLEKGKERRKTATTLMNAQSSRSHTVFSILVHIRENGIDGEEMLKIGKLNLVDLAGSENISKAGNEKGIRTRETVNINQSLLTLGRVITALVERTPHIPYRESKLTRLLQESLGGRTKTSIIANISPGHKDLEETLSTLDYAHRAKNIQNKPEINQKLTKKTVLKEYTEEIDRLKRDLMAARDKNGIFLAEETYNDMHYRLDSQNKELNEKMLLIKALKDEVASKERIFNEVSLHLIEKTEELKKTETDLSETKGRLVHTTKVLKKTERCVEEKSHLVDSHMKTEKKLTGQAKQLIEVADIATSDTNQLHNTIERRKNVDVKIQTACETFADKMDNIFDTMNDQLATLSQEHKSHSQIIVDEIGKNVADHKKFSTNATDRIQSISKSCVESLGAVQACRNKYAVDFSDANEKHKAAFEGAMNELKTKEGNFKALLEEHFAEILQLITQQNVKVTKNCSNVIERITEHDSNLSGFVSETCGRLGAFADEAKATLDSNIEAINKAIEVRKDIVTKRQIVLDSFLKGMKQLEEEENEESSRLYSVAESESQLNSRVAVSVEAEIKTIRELGVSTTKTVNDVHAVMNELNSESRITFEKGTQSNATIKEALEQNENSKQAALESLEKMTIGHVTNFNEIFDGYKKNAASDEETLKERMDSECDEMASLLVKETERVKHYQTQCRALNKSLQNSVCHYSSKCDASLVDCREQLHTFKSSELKTYSSTGLTPSRKEFTYPRVLATTSPHVNIIRRFRMEKEWLDSDTTTTSIAEDSEIPIYEVSDDELGINSTPVRPAEQVEELLKEIQTPNRKNNVLKSFDEKSSMTRKNSSAVEYDKENKENCIA